MNPGGLNPILWQQSIIDLIHSTDDDRSDPNKVNLGRNVCKMCDRNTQINNFLRFFQNKSEELPKRPQVYVIHGSRQEAPESLMEVFRERLTKYLEAKMGINNVSSPPLETVYSGLTLADWKFEKNI